MDMTESIVPTSSQLNAEDLLASERTVTIRDVRKGPSAEQPIAFVLDEFGPDRPYLPCKSMRRVAVAGWGVDASTYTGRRLTIYNDPDVRWGGMAVGGIRIRAMSHLDKPLKLALTVTRGKRAPYVVQALPDADPPADGITPGQSKLLFAVLGKVGLSAKEAALEYLTEHLGRPVTSSKELTQDEAARVIAALEHSIGVPPNVDTATGVVEDPPAEPPWPGAAKPADA